MSGDGFSINMSSAIDGFAQDHQLNDNPSGGLKPNPPNAVAKKKRNLPGTPGKQVTSISFFPTYPFHSPGGRRSHTIIYSIY
ncbi:hypothetical protein DVH24_001531 [Malus domestica]|uniref:Uncharacterized protein n=1 Tax=Malus domestica TaxID=3750 RepID=A0A498K1M9_MALDO|nr:hypothetical protein DVH24_001531 [Malus domestica]